MKSVCIPLAVGLLGVGLGWILGAALRDDAPETGGPEPIEQAAHAPEDAAEPTLVGLPPPPPPASTVSLSASPPARLPGPSEEDLEVVSILTPEEFEIFAGLEVELGASESAHRGWHALLTLYALAGRLDDFQRVVPRALEAGLDRDVLLDLLQLLPLDMHVAALDHVLAAYPDGTWSVATLADVYTGAGAGERAVDVLVPALEAGADSDLAGRLVRADPDRAARILGALGGGDDWTAEMLGQIGSAFVSVQRPDLAMTFLQDALAREPVNHGVLMTLAEVDASLAIEHARRLTRDHAERGDVWTWLGQLEADAGNAAAAFEAYREAAEIDLTTEVLFGMLRADPERAYEAAAELSSRVTNDEVLGAVAKIALKSGRSDDAMATLLRAHQVDPSDHEWMAAMVALDPESAVEILGRTAAAYGGDSRDEVLGAYGNALLGLGRADEAYERYREAFELDPSDWEWQRGLARANPERSIPMLEARYEEVGDEGDLLGALADAYAGVGRRDDALAHYQRAVDHGGGDEWYTRMGLLDSERALAGLQQRVQANPEAGEAWGALGDLHRQLGNREAARAAYDEARVLNTTNLLYEIRYREMGG